MALGGQQHAVVASSRSDSDSSALWKALDVGTMAERLRIAPHTVEWHIRHLIEKLQVHSKLQVVIEAARKGLIDL